MKLALLLVGLIVLTGVTFVSLPKKAECSDCPVGKKCHGDLDCDQLMCNLSCTAVDNMGLDKRCMVR